MRQACTVLYDALPPLESNTQRAMLQRLVGPCTLEWSSVGPAGPGAGSPPVMGGVASFGEHTVAMIGIPAPVRAEVLDVTVGVSPMPDAERAALMGHSAAIRLLYIGDGQDQVEQLSALYRVAGMLLSLGGLGIINERAALAQPAELVESLLPQLGADTPPIQLWTGAVTFNMGEGEDSGRYLVRTYGMDQCSLPELALYINRRAQADDAYHTLMNVSLYLVQSRFENTVGVGDRVEFLGRTFLLTDPSSAATELASDTGLLLLVEV